MSTISLEDLKAKSESLEEGAVLLDVRTPSEFEEYKISGSINIDHTEVDEHTDQLKGYSHIYIYCKKGGRAKKAFDALSDEGLTNLSVVIDGGMESWKEKGYPTE